MRCLVETNAVGVIMLNEEIKSSLSNKSRRLFLKGFGGATVLGGLSSTLAASVQADVGDVETDILTVSGYRETQHIKDYYDSL